MRGPSDDQAEWKPGSGRSAEDEIDAIDAIEPAWFEEELKLLTLAPVCTGACVWQRGILRYHEGLRTALSLAGTPRLTDWQLRREKHAEARQCRPQSLGACERGLMGSS